MIPAHIRLSVNLHYYQELKRIDNQELARISNVSKFTICKYRQGGTKEPKLEIVKKLAKALNVNVYDLLKEEEMFKTWKENQKLKEQLKQKATENTAILVENNQLKQKINDIEMEIDKFDHVKGNTFTLINKIKEKCQNEHSCYSK